jgi:hypothetical protein
MSRRSFPRIDPASLRDHADEARVERVWDRVEHDLVSRADRFERRGRRSSPLGYLAIAAAFAAFGAGLWVGKITWNKPAAPTEAPMAAAVIDKSRVEVLAAGSQSRTFPLEGGARLTLKAGSTVEVERSGGAVTVSLLQGEASIDNTIAPHNPLAVIAGDARLNTQAGTFSVTRNADDIDVNVDEGSVSVSAPGGAPQQLGKHEHAKVPLRTLVSSAPQNAPPHRAPPGPPRKAKGDKLAQKAAAAPPDWLIHHVANDDDGALILLRKQGINEAIDTARSASELFAIVDIVRRRGSDPDAVKRAYTRIVEVFPRAQLAPVAADQLAKMYEGANPDLAKKYREQATTLAQNAPAGADALFCNVILHEPDKDKAARMAKEYLADHPDADCRSTLEQLLAPPEAPSPTDPAPALAPAPAPALAP